MPTNPNVKILNNRKLQSLGRTNLRIDAFTGGSSRYYQLYTLQDASYYLILEPGVSLVDFRKNSTRIFLEFGLDTSKILSC